jgi:hypothetical protein
LWQIAVADVLWQALRSSKSTRGLGSFELSEEDRKMGSPLNPNANIALGLENGDENSARELGILDSKNLAFVFAQVRAQDENALSYIVIGPNEPDGAALRAFFQSLDDGHPLRNIKDAFLQRKPLGGLDPVVLSPCCVDSKNVAVILVGKKDGSWTTVTMLDRYVHAEFNTENPDPAKWPITKLDIRTRPIDGAKYCRCK